MCPGRHPVQASGQDAESWEDWFELRVRYADTRSLPNDLRVLWRTVHSVLGREEISAEGEATMTKFEGSSRDSMKEGSAT